MATPRPPAYVPQPPAVSQGGNGLAIVGFVCGLIGLVLCFIPIIGWILASLGIIVGALGIGKAKQMNGRGKGLAAAGVVCGGIGIVVGVALVVLVVPAFQDYTRKAKMTESTLYLRRIDKSIKRYYMENSALPPSSTLSLPGVDGGACAAGGKMPAKPPSEWTSDPAWRALDFAIDGPSLYSYHWTKVSDTEGYITAVGDLDCDGVLSTTLVDVHATSDRVTSEFREPTPD